ncbi:hypothetical protein H0H93_001448, partial [Arthromyces matolae]
MVRVLVRVRVRGREGSLVGRAPIPHLFPALVPVLVRYPNPIQALALVLVLLLHPMETPTKMGKGDEKADESALALGRRR